MDSRADVQPGIELAGLPDAVTTGLAKAGVALWKAAEAEAAAIMVRERLCMAEAIAAKRELRQEVLGMVDARDAVIEVQRSEIAWFVDELERQIEHLRTLKARDFSRRVVQDVSWASAERAQMVWRRSARKKLRQIYRRPV